MLKHLRLLDRSSRSLRHLLWPQHGWVDVCNRHPIEPVALALIVRVGKQGACWTAAERTGNMGGGRQGWERGLRGSVMIASQIGSDLPARSRLGGA